MSTDPTANLVLTPVQLATWELLAGGWLPPATGFVEPEGLNPAAPRLPVDPSWPLTLEVPASVGGSLVGQRVALRDPEGVLLGTMTVEGATPSAAAQGQVVLHGPQTAAASAVRYDHADLRRPLSAIVGAESPGMVVAAGQPLTDAAIDDVVARFRTAMGEGTDSALFLASLVGPAPADDHGLHTLVRAHAHNAARLREQIGPVIHVVVPLPPVPVADESAAQAGAGSVVAHAMRALARGDVIIWDHASTGARPLDEYAPEVAALLRRREPAPDAAGLTLFFTGLSGSGKSTVAGAVMARLHAETDRTITLLDGDLVRQHLSSELTFSREHRDLNITRIGFVAAEVTKHRGIAICAPIAPYAATRERVREMVQAHGRFVLIHVATPLEVCEARDRKGLYAKARSGEIPSFTGISDPYEAPTDADLVLDTTHGSVADAAAQVIDHLRANGLLAADIPA